MNKAARAWTGAQAPDFTLRDAEGSDWQLSDHLGQVVVLLFYPGDETPTCTKQMCSVRDRWQDYVATGAEVMGISTDTEESHHRFSDHHKLPLTLLSDVGGRVAQEYGAKSFIPGRAARAVVVIDAKGFVRYRKLKPLVGLFVPPSDDEVIAAIKEAQVDASS